MTSIEISQQQQLKEEGFAVIPKALSGSDLQTLISHCKKLLDRPALSRGEFAAYRSSDTWRYATYSDKTTKIGDGLFW